MKPEIRISNQDASAIANPDAQLVSMTHLMPHIEGMHMEAWYKSDTCMSQAHSSHAVKPMARHLRTVTSQL